MKPVCITALLVALTACDDRVLPRQLWLNRGLTEANVILQDEEPHPF